MQTKQIRLAPDEGASRRYKAQFFNKPLQTIKKPKFFKRKKQHWSRHPAQRQKDRKILAMVGLRFQPVAGTFHRLRFGGEEAR